MATPRPKIGVVVATASPTLTSPGTQGRPSRAPLPAVGVAQRPTGEHVGHRRGALRDRSRRPGRGWPGRRPRRRPGGAGPSAPHRRSAGRGRRRSGPARAGTPAPGSRRSRPARPADWTWAGLGAVVQAVLPVHVRHAARTADRGGSPLRVDAPAGPPGRVHDQVRLDRGAVDDDAAHASGRRDHAVDVSLPDGQARHRVRRRPQGALEGVAAGPVPGRDGAHARHVERDRLGAGASHASRASGHSRSSAIPTCGRKPCAWWNCMTPGRGQWPGGGRVSRSTATTSWPRRASALPRNRPAGPAPMIATRMRTPRPAPRALRLRQRVPCATRRQRRSDGQTTSRRPAVSPGSAGGVVGQPSR